MKIEYDDKYDMLYIRFDESQQNTINQRLSDNIVLDIGSDNKIVGIEILEAKEILNLKSILPIEYSMTRFKQKDFAVV